jgi:hypothetical protein
MALMTDFLNATFTQKTQIARQHSLIMIFSSFFKLPLQGMVTDVFHDCLCKDHFTVMLQIARQHNLIMILCS